MSTKIPTTAFLRNAVRLGLVLVLLVVMLLNWVIPQAAASPNRQVAPTATTEAATEISTYAATLNGTVNAGGASTTVQFEYGEDITYGTTLTAEPSPVNGTTVITASLTIADLQPNTTYHFRIRANNTISDTLGEDMSFTTRDFVIPTVVTQPASNMTISSAILNGVVNAQGESTTVYFEYGLDTSYGTSVNADQSPLSDSVDENVSKEITGLQPDTAYHYRIVAENAGRTVLGTDQTFTTLPSTAAITTYAASDMVADTAVLNGLFNAAGPAWVVFFEYGLTTDYGRIVEATQTPVSGSNDVAISASIDGLISNTTYNYRAVARKGDQTLYGGNQSFTSSDLPIAITLDATSISTTDATLQGQVNPNSQSTDVTFEYGLTTDYGTTVSADQNPVSGSTLQNVNKPISGLINATIYHYRVVATNSAGTAFGDDVVFFTTDSVTTPPTVSTDPATAILVDGATLNGTVNANGSNSTIWFEYGLDTTYGRLAQSTPNLATATTNTPISSTLEGLSPNTTYHYRAAAQNANGTTYGADMTFTTGVHAPSVTTGGVSLISSTSATVNGSVNAYNDSTTVTFEYGQTTTYGDNLAADQSPVNGMNFSAVSVSLLGLTDNTLYHYRVVGVNSGGTTYGADQLFTTGDLISTTATTLPASDVRAVDAVLNGSVNPNGNATTVYFEYGLDTYYGREADITQGSLTGSNDTAVNASLSNLLIETTYHYRVVAVNASGTFYGDDLIFTTGILPTAVTDPASEVLAATARLNGTVNAGTNETSVTFEYGLDTNYGTTATADPNLVNGITDTAVTQPISGLVPATTYHYRVVAENVNGTAYGSDQTFTTKVMPNAVTLPASSVLETAATLNGIVNAQNEDTTVYFEYGLDTSYGNSTAVDPDLVQGAIDTPVSKTLNGLLSNSTYHFRVVAQNVNGIVYGEDQTFVTATYKIILPLIFKNATVDIK